ncbi:uncharacterized protein LOC106511743 [Austrofundulus limnaeus]|uniref:Uncharacterized protein LOC106511743 n=1 Tax=Austrofundulus limnaeus TaxID=52670 RepID=A0A2I4AKF0_AUSLI|nr:PREDICTED: uncharacterized protein LOC106511743 [Austrofundulus limnaeus]
MWVEYAHNTLVSSSTGLTPFEASLGYTPPLFPQEEKNILVPSIREHVARCKKVWTEAREALERAAGTSKRTADKRRVDAPDYRVNQRVWLSTKDVHLKDLPRKMAPRFIGPYPIDKIISPTAVKLKLPPSMRIHPTFHVSQIKPVNTSKLCPPPEPPPPPILVDKQPAYLVSRILDARRRGRGFQFLVDWEGYGPEDRSWIPGSFILNPTLISDFFRDHPEKRTLRSSRDDR